MINQKINEKFEAIDKLKSYNGENPYLLRLKYDIFNKNDASSLTDFVIEYINQNSDFSPIKVNKIVKLSDWLGENLKKKYSIDFAPQKFLIISFLGETSSYFHVYGKWRKNMSPIEVFLNKKGVLNNFLLDDYHNIQVNFQRYNDLLSLKDKNRRVKPHQEEAVKFLLSRKKCILADDMGLGKSMSLSIAAIEGNFDAVLIICPASLKTVWKKELSWFVPERDITIVEGFSDKNKNELEEFLGYGIGKSGKKKDELLKEAKEIGKWKDNRFVIVNFDVLDEFYTPSYVRTEDALSKVANENPLLKYIFKKKSLIIIDEAHNLSNSTSDRYKIIKNLINKGKPHSIYLSTGTPITNRPENYFNLIQLIGDSITDDWDFYMKRYCDAKRFPAKGERERCTKIFLNKVKKDNWFKLTDEEKDELKEFIKKNAKMITVAKGASNLDELKEKTSHIYLRRIKDDIKNETNLKNKVVKEIFYTLTNEQKAEYENLWLEYENSQKEINPDKVLNKELTEGALYRKYCSEQMVPHTIEIANYHLNNNEKVVIMCCYDNELYQLKEYFGDKCVIYNGKMSLKEKDKAKDLFLNDDSIKVFIGNIDAAGAGLTLISSHIMIFNNISFVPADNQQAMDRIYRIGQTNDVIIYVQIFKDTEYEKIWDTILSKEMTINKVIKKEDEK